MRVGGGVPSTEQPATMGGQLTYLPLLDTQEEKDESKGQTNNTAEILAERTPAEKMKVETKTEARTAGTISGLEKAALSLLLFK